MQGMPAYFAERRKWMAERSKTGFRKLIARAVIIGTAAFIILARFALLSRFYLAVPEFISKSDHNPPWFPVYPGVEVLTGKITGAIPVHRTKYIIKIYVDGSSLVKDGFLNAGVHAFRAMYFHSSPEYGS